MNVKTVKKPKRRVDIGYVSRFKMQAYGYDNLYPQNLARITEASGTAMLCLNRYARFIEGYGFDSDILASLAMNPQGDTADDLLRNVAQDLARFGGFALHVNYNVLGQVSSVSHVPLKLPTGRDGRQGERGARLAASRLGAEENEERKAVDGKREDY